MTKYSITFQNLKKCFKDRTIFDIPELIINTGECVLLSGINGSGKSTLLRTIAGLETPTSANIIHNNRTIRWKLAHKQIHKEIIYMHQDPLMFDASVSDNITYGMRKQGFSTKDIQSKLEKSLQWAELEHLKFENARHLSGGEKQRVALARAYVLSPKVLLLDEAFSNMDIEGRKRTFDLICKLKDEGIGIILTSHEVTQIISLTKRHLKLENGQLLDINHKGKIISGQTKSNPLSLVQANA